MLPTQLTHLLEPRSEVLALAIFGSQYTQKADQWSDWDVILVVEDDALQHYFPNIEWLNPLGEIFTYSQSQDAFRATTRLCFADLQRLDLVITTPQGLTHLAEWTRIPFWQGVRILFSRSDEIAELLQAKYPSPTPSNLSDNEFKNMANEFRFKAVLALTKLARADNVIALHLTFDLWRDVCVLVMILRDKQVLTDEMANQGLAKWQGMGCYEAASILESIEQSCRLFEGYIRQFEPDYAHSPLYKLIEQVRHSISP
jgi:hypothetical protein